MQNDECSYGGVQQEVQLINMERSKMAGRSSMLRMVTRRTANFFLNTVAADEKRMRAHKAKERKNTE